jgi:thiamine-phosphate pyrophosphorylase
VRSLVITDAAGRGEDAFTHLLDEMRAAAPDLFQVREKSESDRSLLARVIRARRALPASTKVVVNGRPDVAMVAGADGVHLPSDGLPVADVRRAFPPPFLVGVSCHRVDELARAAEDGADFAVLAPIYAVPGKSEAPLGPEVLDRFAPPLPLYALGGMTVERVASWPEERRRGLSGVAAIGLFHTRGGAAVRELRELGGVP